MKEFLTEMIGNIYKILPLNDENNIGTLSYIESIAIQLTGSLETFPELKNNQKYISIINSINYLSKNNFTKNQCRREILRSTNILQHIIEDWR